MRLSLALVDRRAAACVNILPNVRSIYRWQGKVEQADELLLVIKTTAGRVRDIERLLADLHPYDVPECVVLAPDRVERKYLAWLRAEASPAGGRSRTARVGGGRTARAGGGQTARAAERRTARDGGRRTSRVGGRRTARDAG